MCGTLPSASAGAWLRVCPACLRSREGRGGGVLALAGFQQQAVHSMSTETIIIVVVIVLVVLFALGYFGRGRRG